MRIIDPEIPGHYILQLTDKKKFDYIQPIIGGKKVRNRLELLFPKKAALKIWTHFPNVVIKSSKEIDKEIKSIHKIKKQRIENIKKIKQQYKDGKISFNYDYSKAKYPPLDHQKIMYNIVRYTNSGGLLSEAGTMKTGPYLWAIDDYLKHGKIKRALIITLSQLKRNVLEEMKMQIPHRSAIALNGKTHSTKVFKKQFKRKGMNRDYDIYIANYESMFSIVDLFDDNFFDLVLLDEAHRIGGYNTRQTETILEKFINTPKKYIVTGSLNDQDIMSHHTPIKFLGEDNIPIVHYLTAKANYMTNVAERVWVEKKWKRNEVARIVANIGVEYRKEDVIKTLPPVLEIPKYIEMSPEQKRMTKELKDELITIIEDMCNRCSHKDNCDNDCIDTLQGKNALVLIGKFQQIANGFIQRKIERIGDDAKEDTIYIDFKDNPKLKLLDDVLDEIGDNKVIIWSNRIRSLETIYKHIQNRYKGKKNKGVLRIWGTDKAFNVVEKFKDPKYQYLVANPAKASTGLNIQFSNYQITFDNSYSYREYNQKVSRQHRGMQTNVVTVFQLCLLDSIDITILGRLANKKDLSFDLGRLARVIVSDDDIFGNI